jgi:cytochrome d ubiquinol oxidase subunit II
MHSLSTMADILPLVFLALMGLCMLIYVVLDGYDLGVGILLRRATNVEKDQMIASIGPFWDANETWLVLGVGILLTAFPHAHGIVLGELYLPVSAMLGFLILRGVAFDFRAKVAIEQKHLWNKAFYVGSLGTTFCQGVMLAEYITGFSHSWASVFFSVFVGLSLIVGYCLLGATWLVLRAEGELQLKAARWAKACLLWTLLGLAAISLATPWVSERIFDRWFSFPNFLWLSPIPVLTALSFVFAWRALSSKAVDGTLKKPWLPFALTVSLFVLSFCGLAFSIVPFVIVDRMTAWEAAAAPEALEVIAIGAAVVLPAILAYTGYVYWLFRGKVVELSYY